MKEIHNQVTMNFDIADKSTGEVINMSAISNETVKYYSIKKITSRINSMNFLNVLETVCKSSKDISIVNSFLEEHSQDNIVRIAIGKFAEEMNVSRQKISTLIRRMIQCGFIKKVDTGMYFINPFIWVGRRVKSNILREEAQSKWNEEN